MHTPAYVRPGLVYMAGSERRNCIVIVFMGSQPARSERNALSCSSGGLGRNRRWKRGLAYRRMEEMALCSTGHIRNEILFIGRGLAYRKTEETDLLRSKRGPVDREGCGVPQNGGNGVVLDLHHRPPPASTGYCSSTVDLLRPPLRLFIHGLLFIQPPPHAPPPAIVQPALASLLFNQPSTGFCSTFPPRGPIHPALHRVLFIHAQPT